MDDQRDEADEERPGTEPDRSTAQAAGEPGEPGDPDEVPGDPDEALDEAAPAGSHTALPPKIEAWRRRSAAGAILTGFALGLQQALETRKEEPSIVMETSGDPPRDLPVEADFEYGRPRQSVVQIRPWLLPEGAPPAPDREPAADEEEEG